MTKMRQKKSDNKYRIVIPNETIKPRIGVLHTRFEPNKKNKNKNRIKHKNRIFE